MNETTVRLESKTPRPSDWYLSGWTGRSGGGAMFYRTIWWLEMTSSLSLYIIYYEYIIITNLQIAENCKIICMRMCILRILCVCVVCVFVCVCVCVCLNAWAGSVDRKGKSEVIQPYHKELALLSRLAAEMYYLSIWNVVLRTYIVVFIFPPDVSGLN